MLTSAQRAVRVVSEALLSTRRKGARQCLKEQLIFFWYFLRSTSGESFVFVHQAAGAVTPRAGCSVRRRHDVPARWNSQPRSC